VTAAYDAWLVDLDGTLYRARWVKIAMAVELGLGGWVVVGTLRRFRHEHERLRLELSDDVDSPYSIQIERTATALALDRGIVEARVTEWMIQRPTKWIRRFANRALLEEIAAFRTQGGKTALVSDYPASTKLEALGHSGLFDVIVASGEPEGPKRLKPHPDGYLAAARRLGVAPERCLVIGDRQDADGAAAAAAGMAFRRV
jgi:HAD superfamily hydrolase (TIGR01509 family)